MQAVTNCLGGHEDTSISVTVGRRVTNIQINSPEREATREELTTYLTQQGIEYSLVATSKSSFDAVKIMDGTRPTTIVFKPNEKFGTPDKTRFVESAHALFLQIAVGERRDVVPDDLYNHGEKYAQKVQINVDTTDIISKITPDWIQSACTTANVLRPYASNNSVIHRDSHLEAAFRGKFQVLNREQRVFGGFDKFQPADIYIVNPDCDLSFSAYKSFDAFNEYLLEQFNNGNFRPVSLKKVKNEAVIHELNTTPDREQFHLLRHELSSKSGTVMSTKSNYLYAGSDQCVHRCTMRTAGKREWAFELKGKETQLGKVGKNVAFGIAQRHGLTLDESQSIEHLVSCLATESDGQYTQAPSADWHRSKHTGLVFLKALHDATPEQQTAALTEIVSYAGSQSEFSAPYLRVS